MADLSASDGAESEPSGGASRKFQSFIFNRELAEVYLLLDHLSGRADKELLDDPKAPWLVSEDGQTPVDWIHEVARIVWPPQTPATVQASDAATLIRVRDHLNRNAAPASGATIAFTLLVAGEDRAGGRHRAGEPRRIDGPPDAPSRLDLAETAFPTLGGRARRFRLGIGFIAAWMLIWLACTCFLSWDVATGQGLLAQYTAAQADLTDIQTKIYATVDGSAVDSGRSGPKAAATKRSSARGAAPSAPTALAKPGPVIVDCSRAATPPPAQTDAAGPPQLTTQQWRLCQQQKTSQDASDVASKNVANWTSGWLWLHCLPTPTCVFCGRRPAPAQNPNNPQWTSTLLNILAGGVLPICYGVIGAAAAVVRNLSAKMRESLLAPRDFQLSLIQLALGAVLGACIGLFVAPSGANSSGANATSGLLSTLGLSASAMCFIAGFFVEGVFVALEALMRRVFDVADPTKKS